MKIPIMKTFQYLLIVLACSSLLFSACETPEIKIDQHWNAYKLAMIHGDIPTAIVEVNSIYALDTTSQSVLDTMMRLYFVQRNFVSTYKVGAKIDDKDFIHKSILAESTLQLGLVNETKALMMDIEANDSVGLNISTKYKLATMHFNDEEYAETLQLLGKIVDNEVSLEQATRISGDDNVTQNVSLYAASHNFAGFVFMQINEFDTAEDHFTEALRVQIDFQLAKNNLVQLEEKRAEAQ